MAEPGWYHDPTGTDRYRYWDGAAWSETTSSELTTAPPAHDGEPPRPVRRWPLVVAALVVVVAVVVALAFNRGGGTSPVEETTTTSSPESEDPQTPAATQTSVDLCAAGNLQYLSTSKQKNVVHSGLAIDFPQDWGFRLDVDQVAWLEDVYPFGTIADGKEAAIIIGRQPISLPTDLTMAVQQNWLCFAARGFLQDDGLPDELPSTVEKIETNGIPGAQATVTTTTSQGKEVVVTVRVYNAGDVLVTFIGYHDQGGAAAVTEQIRTTLDTIRRG